MRRVALLGLASLLALRLVFHLEEPFLHNKIDLFLDVLCAAAAVLLVANAFGFARLSWARTVGPVLAGLAAVILASRVGGGGFQTPGYRLARWAEQSPWRGHVPPPFFVDVDPWLILAADLLVFTTVFSLIMIGIVLAKRRGVLPG